MQYQVHPYILAQAAISNQVSLDDVITNVKAYFSMVQIQRVKEFMDNMQQMHNVLLKDDHTADKIRDFLQRLKLTKDSINIKFISVDGGFVKTWKDMSEIVEGSDTSNYDGTPLIMYENVSEEQMQLDNETETYSSIYADLTVNDKMNEESDVNESSIEAISMNLLNQFSALKTCNEGALEVMLAILPILLKIKDTSGLPWSYDSINQWINYCSSSTLNRQSRAQQLKTSVEDISLIVAQGLCASTQEASLYKIRQLNNTKLSESLLRIYPGIHTEWKESCLVTLTSGLVEFWLECLEKSVKGMLDFSILNGIVSLVNVWSPYGLPLDDMFEQITKDLSRLVYHYRHHYFS
ncbi:MAG: hypothetical protein EB127_30175 [Alphaproteobacteria bacterium]|nr:hypothetical protein [Alphaproteobacteria bacterium]